MKITLVRHGKPAASSNERVTSSGFAKWVRAYNLSYIEETSLPPDQLAKQLMGHYIFSSDLNRAHHSAQLCLGKQPDAIMSELREMDIPRFRWPLTMSINKWLVLSRVCWLLGFSAKSESFLSGRERAVRATEQIIEQASITPNIAVFGHGVANRLIAKELKRRGWEVQANNSGFWGITELTRTAPV
ncbi:histidine phosphatase family protein [Vibrio kasasachensis]|uniref:histidine phosphatase family protein n=1 Tax=Vibrio kasasachensis TaxID=2910248 RepID=UPI003D0E586A